MDLSKKYKQLFEGKFRSNDASLINEAYTEEDLTDKHSRTMGDGTPAGRQIWTNKPLRKNIEQYVDNNSPNGAKAAFNMSGAIPMVMIHRYVTQEKTAYKNIADSIDNLREWSQGMQDHVNGVFK